jgi:hypothetical protein
MPRTPARPTEPLSPVVYRNVFEDHPEGRQILEELMRRFSMRSGAVTEGGIDAVLKTYERAGARKVLEFIVARINQANGVPPDEVEPE